MLEHLCCGACKKSNAWLAAGQPGQHLNGAAAAGGGNPPAPCLDAVS